MLPASGTGLGSVMFHYFTAAKVANPRTVTWNGQFFLFFLTDLLYLFKKEYTFAPALKEERNNLKQVRKICVQIAS